MAELAYVNGVFSPISQAMVSIEDRGFQFGDGAYEVIASYGGVPFLLEEHFARLRSSVSALVIDFDPDDAGLKSTISEGIRRCGFADVLIYIQVTRGVAPRTHEFPEQTEPTVVLTFKPLPQLSPESRRRGVRVVTTLDDRWSSCHIKAITLLPNVLAKNDALRQGYDDALFVTGDGEVRECTSANVFVVHGENVAIPRRDGSILRGVTQSFILDCASELGLNIEEREVRVDELHTADEVFLTNTILGVTAVTSIDDRAVGDGTVGPVSCRVYDELSARCRSVTAGRATSERVAS